MTGEILHVADVSNNLMANPSLQIIAMGGSRQIEDASNPDDLLESLTEVQP